MMTVTHLSSLADIFTIIASIVTAVALYVSARQFYKTQISTREAQAIELFLKWNDLSAEQEKIRPAEKSIDSTLNPSHWIGNNKMAITEALFELTRESREWSNTLRWMLEMQSDFIIEGDFDIDTYTPDFREFCKRAGFPLRRSSQVRKQ